MQNQYRKGGQLLLGLFLGMALLVSTHLGEYWPFSIYPMFSQGGKPWVRSHVRVVADSDRTDALWRTVALDSLPGEPYPLRNVGVNQNDVSNFISKSETWNERRVSAMRKLFAADLTDKNLLILRVDGKIGDDERVSVAYSPFLLLTPDSTYFNPHRQYPGLTDNRP